MVLTAEGNATRSVHLAPRHHVQQAGQEGGGEDDHAGCVQERRQDGWGKKVASDQLFRGTCLLSPLLDSYRRQRRERAPADSGPDVAAHSSQQSGNRQSRSLPGTAFRSHGSDNYALTGHLQPCFRAPSCCCVLKNKRLFQAGGHEMFDCHEDPTRKGRRNGCFCICSVACQPSILPPRPAA